MLRLAAAVAIVVGLSVATARAQTPQVRLAGSLNCKANVNCIPGLKRVYGMDPSSLFVPRQVADAGVQALDDGVAEVAVVFSSNPQLSRPDIVSLRDDRHMVTADHIVPVVRRSLLRRYGRPLRRRLNTASRLLSTFELRGLNQKVIDGRLPEAVGGEFADANGLGGPAHRRGGPRITIGYQAFDENQTLAHLYAEALRGVGFRVRVRAAGGLRPETITAFRHRRIDMWPGYSGSLLGYLGGRSLERALARIGARPLERSPAQDRESFGMKREVADRLGVHTLSDLKRYWPPASASARATASADARQGEQWAVASGSVLDLPGAWQLANGTGVTVAVIDSGARLEHPDLAPNIWTNFDEVPGNHVDDDRNGYVDDVHGVDLSSTRPGQNLSDGWGHGTHTAGIVAAARNGRGVVGVAPRAKLMIVKVLDSRGAGTTGGVAEGIRYAAANGARVINLSLSGPERDPRLVSAVKAAGDANALLVTSAGNDGVDIDTKPVYPAALPAANLLAVASTEPDSGRGLSQFSNFGRLAVQVAAPGAQILSTASDGGYVIKSGTSMSAPMVAGVAALAASVNPNLSAADLRALVTQNAVRSRLRVASGYVDALHTVLAAGSGGSQATTQAPSVKILAATRKGRRTRIQVAVLGSIAAIHRYRVQLGRKTVTVAGRRSHFQLTLRRSAKRVRVAALDAAGHTLAGARRKVAKLRKGKRDVRKGGGVRT